MLLAPYNGSLFYRLRSDEGTVYGVRMLTLDEYKRLHGSRFEGMSEADIQRLFDVDSTFASFAIKCWLASRQTEPKKDDTIDELPTCPEIPTQ